MNSPAESEKNETMTSGSTGSTARSPRLTVRIGVFYTLLAVTNIIFFSIMIFENQTDLLQNNFRYHSENIVRTVLGDLDDLRLRRQADQNLDQLKTSLAPFDIRDFLIFDHQGTVWHYHTNESAGATAAPTEVSSKLQLRADELTNQELVFRSRYSLVLNEDDFSIDLLLPLRGVGERGPEKIFLSTSLSIRDMQNRLNALYYQVAIAVVWGVVFHILFAFFVYRLIFVRLNVLKAASLRMATGDLDARANFPYKPAAGGDELDDLGGSFNTMAAGIQEKVETISDQFTTIRGLNDEIQLEMRIGKEVQESFASVSPDFAAFHPAVYYQPLREVSGDIYNFYSLKDQPSSKNNSVGTHALFFADATGHGVSAALITAIVVLSLEELLRAADPRSSPAPDLHTEFAAQIMTDLNQILANRLNPFFHATALILLFQENGEIIFSNAGHTPCYAVRPATREVFYLNAHGTPLGMVEDMTMACDRLATQPGDKLLIYSDGYTEAYNNTNGEEYTRERALNLFRESAHLRPDRILEILKVDLFAHTCDFKDDVTVLVLEIPGPGASEQLQGS